MEKLEIRALPINMDDSSFDGTSLSGVVNVPGSQSEILTDPITGRKFREVIQPGTFANALNQGSTVDFLYQHDKQKILSTTDNDSLQLHEDDEAGLVMKAKISQTSWGKDAYQLIKDKIVKSMSFGMKVLHDTWLKGSDNIPLRVIDKISLIEVSAVRNPAYVASNIEARGIDIQEVNIPDMEERDLADSQASVEEREAWQDEPQSAPSQVVMSLSDDAKDFLNSLVQSLSGSVAQSAEDAEDAEERADDNETEVDTDSSDDGTGDENETVVEPDDEQRSKEDSQEIETRSKEEQELVNFFA